MPPSPSVTKVLDPRIEGTRRKIRELKARRERARLDEKKFRAMLDRALTRADDHAFSASAKETARADLVLMHGRVGHSTYSQPQTPNSIRCARRTGQVAS